MWTLPTRCIPKWFRQSLSTTPRQKPTMQTRPKWYGCYQGFLIIVCPCRLKAEIHHFGDGSTALGIHTLGLNNHLKPRRVYLPPLPPPTPHTHTLTFLSRTDRVVARRLPPLLLSLSFFFVALFCVVGCWVRCPCLDYCFRLWGVAAQAGNRQVPGPLSL